jgi:hypothetical protein
MESYPSGADTIRPYWTELLQRPLYNVVHGPAFEDEYVAHVQPVPPRLLHGLLSAVGSSQLAVDARVSTTEPAPKRSTERGEGRAKLIAALTKHHQYAEGGCLNLEPIGNNALARLAEVANRTASKFFAEEFQGHAKYKVLCGDAGSLAAALKLLNGEYAPYLLYGSNPPEKSERDDGDDNE